MYVGVNMWLEPKQVRHFRAVDLLYQLSYCLSYYLTFHAIIKHGHLHKRTIEQRLEYVNLKKKPPSYLRSESFGKCKGAPVRSGFVLYVRDFISEVHLIGKPMLN